MAAPHQSEHVRRRVIYHGRVQGVFFRATSADLAKRFDVVGGVRNLLDGTVELEAEGPPKEVDALLTAIRQHFERNITRADIDEQSPRRDESDFTIWY